MHIDYNRTMMREAAERSRYRSALLGICPVLSEGSPLDRLLRDDEAPATAVLAQLHEVLGYENRIFCDYIDPERPALEEMIGYATKQIEIEKAELHAKKLVTQAIKAGVGYRAIQSMVVREMDRREIEWPDEGGW